jgi:FO synthase
VTNIQTSWVKMGPDGVKTCLRAGANDLGGTLMDETITRSAGAAHGQEMTPAAMEAIIRSIGRIPRQRDTLYSDVPDERYRASFVAAPARVLDVASAFATGAGGGGSPAGEKSYCSNDSTIL